MYKHILIPTDGSPPSEAAARDAISLAKQLNAKVTAFYATPVFEHRVERWKGLDTGPTRQEFEEYARKEAENALAGITKLAKDQGVSAEGHWEFTNHPYEGIIKTAKARGCDLIFMASHGRSGVTALVLGSETNKVLTHCQIPVLVCR
jgi:nucleotide-binding universal stress UspA family protein